MTNHPAVDLDHLRSWIGSERIAEDAVTLRLAQAHAATFDDNPTDVRMGGAAPVGIHWCLHTPFMARTKDLSPDGVIADEGSFLPPVPLPRRMRGGGQLAFPGSINVGDIVIRKQRVADVNIKSGRSGTLCVVGIDNELSVNGKVVVTERVDAVYREAASDTEKTAPKAAPQPSTLPAGERLLLDAALLARFSALTFNAHRIHLDTAYSTREEGHAGVVVHGPLQATILLKAATKSLGWHPRAFNFRAVSPLILGDQATLVTAEEGGQLSMSIVDSAGRATITANASI